MTETPLHRAFIRKADELAACHRALAETLNADAAIRETTYASSHWSSVAEAKRAMDLAAHQGGTTNDLARLRGEADALHVEWETLRTLLRTTDA